MVTAESFGGVYRGRRVLVTGHTGFKAGWLCLWLRRLGADVHGLGLPAPTQPSLHELVRGGTFASETTADVRECKPIQATIQTVRPEVIFHLAAQPLVRLSYETPVETFETNVMGTIHVLEAVRQQRLNCAVVVITSDKCYENQEWEHSYRESDPLGGHDIYSMSKAAAELVVSAWRRSFFRPDPRLGPVASARAGNVIGGGDYAADRIIPDCVRALIAGQPVRLRNPEATRPWQHVLDCLSGYLLLGAQLLREGSASEHAAAFNFGPGPQTCLPVRVVVEEMLKYWPGTWERTEVSSLGPHEAGRLGLSIDRAVTRLGWTPVWSFAEAIRHTAAWYVARHAQGLPDMLTFTVGQLDAFCADARAKGVDWMPKL